MKPKKMPVYLRDPYLKVQITLLSGFIFLNLFAKPIIREISGN
jgi:hypothetical protein